MSDVLLVHPPFWDPYGPPASTAALLGHLRSDGIRAAQIDLNQKYFAERYEAIIASSLADIADAETFANLIPAEHKVVLGITSSTSDLAERWGIDDDLTLPSHRRAIAVDDLPRLNVMDALVHYGYFVRHHPDIAETLVDEQACTSRAWADLKRAFDRWCAPVIERSNPLVIGVSVLGEQQLAPTIAITRWIRDLRFDGLVVWGGSDIRYTHERAAQRASWWRDLPDLLCLGEGETALTQLTHRAADARRAVGAGWAAKVTAGLKRPDGAVAGLVSSPFRSLLLVDKNYEKVNTLAQYDFDGMDLHEGYLMPWPIVPYQGSRGCHWGICGFCDHEEGYRLNYRPKATEQVVDHIEHFRDAFGVTHIQFVDEAVDPQWLVDLNDEIDRRGLTGTFRWSNYSKIGKGLTSEVLRRSHRNGCRLILFGVESFNQRVLGVVRKGIRREEILRTLRDVDAAGIRSWIWLISGLPTQSPDELRGDVRDLRTLDGIVDAVSVARYRMSSNSDIFRDMEKFGIIDVDADDASRVTYRSSDGVVDPDELARIFVQDYYPAAIRQSVTHNRYLLFADAIKSEGSRRRQARPEPRKAVEPQAREVVTPRTPQAPSQAGLGNI